MREGAFWAAILRGWFGSKQLEGGFSPLMWKGRHYWDDDDAAAALPSPLPLSISPSLLWSDLTDWHWEEWGKGRGWLGWGTASDISPCRCNFILEQIFNENIVINSNIKWFVSHPFCQSKSVFWSTKCINACMGIWHSLMRRLPSLPRLGDFLDDNEPIVDRSVIQPNWLCCASRVQIASHICFRLVMPSSSFSHLPTQTCNLQN